MSIKITKGHEKMLQYLDSCLRHSDFKEVLEQYLTCKNKDSQTDGDYNSLSEVQKKEHDRLNQEIGEIIDEYEALRRRAQRLFDNPSSRIEQEIAEEYSIDSPLLTYIYAIASGKNYLADILEDELDVCRLVDLEDDDLNPANPGEEIIHLRRDRQLRDISYPIAIQIHNLATQRDILNFVSKKWSKIEEMQRMHQEKKKRIRKSKCPQAIRDFIWDHRDKRAKDIKELLNKKFPQHGLVYHEIINMIKIEKRRRSGILS